MNTRVQDHGSKSCHRNEQPRFPSSIGRFRTLLASAAALVSLGWCLCMSAPLPPNIVLTEQDNAGTVNAEVGQLILVRLRGNPTTGHTWLLELIDGESVVSSGGPVFEPDPGGGIGVGGFFEFTLKVIQPGPSTLRFIYCQPWNPSAVAAKFTVTILVSNQSYVLRLFIEATDGKVIVRWLATGSEGFSLEYAPTLSIPTWSKLHEPVETDGMWKKVTLPCCEPNLFFRLSDSK